MPAYCRSNPLVRVYVSISLLPYRRTHAHYTHIREKPAITSPNPPRSNNRQFLPIRHRLLRTVRKNNKACGIFSYPLSGPDCYASYVELPPAFDYKSASKLLGRTFVFRAPSVWAHSIHWLCAMFSHMVVGTLCMVYNILTCRVVSKYFLWNYRIPSGCIK